ncbi:MAG TPA: prolipoprotein diacylglyceryl transferase [Pontiella sp.]
MTHYIHNINPILFELGGPVAVRWYGLSYLLGFAASILLLRHWSKRGEFEVPKEEISNFVVLLAFFGVFLGGRVGYVFFYGFDTFLKDPLYLFRIWEGGMASHGGFIGVLLFIFWYAQKHKYSFWNLTDSFACTASLGLTFGRLANFINGELWGRVSNVSWAVVFPQELGLRYGEFTLPDIGKLIESGQLSPRHPSQLYQAFGEGFLVFVIMMLLRRTGWGKRPAALSACYLVLYAIARIAMEFFREPDSTVYFGWLTKGQLYSGLMIIAAVGIALNRKLLKPQTTPN